MLFIGLGGSGGKTIRSLKQQLNRELVKGGYTSGIPDSWQFLQIDVTRDGIDFPAPLLSDNDFLSIAPSGVTYANMVDRLSSAGNASTLQDALSGWAIPASPINIRMGAGQVRAIGRVAGLASGSEIANAIQKKIALMSSPTAVAQLTQISIQTNQMQPKSVPKAFIFSSLTGGTGCGIFNDVKSILGGAVSAQWASSPTSFLYTADVFESVGFSGNQMASNMLGTMNELVSDLYNPLTSAGEVLKKMIGLPAVASSGMNPTSRGANFLIGARNIPGYDISRGLSSSGMNQVFRVVGESLAGVLVNDELSNWLDAISNSGTGLRSSIDASGLAPTNPAQISDGGFSGIGFSRISVGTRYLKEYVADALTREQVRTLLWPDLDFNFSENDPTRRAMIKSQAADDLRYLSSDEDGTEVRLDVQLQNKLISDSVKKKVAHEVRALMVKNVSSDSQDTHKLAYKITHDWITERQPLLNYCETEVSANAAQWILDKQDEFLEKISHCLITNGASSVIQALSDLNLLIAEEYLPVSIREMDEYEAITPTLGELGIRSRIIEIADGLVKIGSSNSETIVKIEGVLRRAAQYEIQLFVFKLVSSILRDFSDNFLTPLIESLIDSRFELQATIKSDVFVNARRVPFESYPEWGSLKVPGSYLPDSGENLLIQPPDYENHYESYSEHFVDGRSAFVKSVRASFLDSDLLQTSPSESYEQLIQGENWITRVREAIVRFDQVPRKTSIKFQLDLNSLANRNEKWLCEKNRSFARLLKLSLSDYVNEQEIDPVERQRRVNEFARHFQQLAYKSAPLLSLNTEALTHIASNRPFPVEATDLKISKIPFDRNSEVGAICLQIMNSFGLNNLGDESIHNQFDATARVQSVWALSSTRCNLPYWTISSVTDPILRKVEESRANYSWWMSFWEGRRSRPLLESIPLHQEIRRSIVTGWMIASILGLRKFVREPHGRSALVMNPYTSSEKWAELPFPLLEISPEDFSQRNWLLPGVLSSVGISMCEFGKTGKSESIEAYLLLKHIGREVTTTIPYRDTWDISGVGDVLPDSAPQMSKFISQWISSGVLPGNTANLLNPLKEKIDLGITREVALLEVVTRLKGEYERNWADLVESPWFQLPHTWELRSEIDMAFDDICEYIRNLSPQTSLNPS